MSNLDDFRSAKINTWPIVALRVYTGIFFLYFSIVEHWLRSSVVRLSLHFLVFAIIASHPSTPASFAARLHFACCHCCLIHFHLCCVTCIVPNDVFTVCIIRCDLVSFCSLPL